MLNSFRDRENGNFDKRIDTETQTRKYLPGGEKIENKMETRAGIEAQDTESGSSQKPEKFEPNIKIKSEEQQGDIISTTECDNYVENFEGDPKVSDYYEDQEMYHDEYHPQEYQQWNSQSYVPHRGEVADNYCQLDDQYQRQADVRNQMLHYARGPNGELLRDQANLSPVKQQEPISIHHDHSAYTESIEEPVPKVQGSQQYDGNFTQTDYIKPIYPMPGSQPSLRARSHRRQHSWAGQREPLDHPHSHQYEDEVCLKCDNEPPLEPLRTDRLPHNSQICDNSVFHSPSSRYPIVSVQDYSEENISVSDTRPRFNTLPPGVILRGSLSNRALPLRPQDRGAYLNQPRPPSHFRYSGPEGVVPGHHMNIEFLRHRGTGSLPRHPVSELSAQPYSGGSYSDQGSLPRRLPEIPYQQSGTLPRVGRHPPACRPYRFNHPHQGRQLPHVTPAVGPPRRPPMKVAQRPHKPVQVQNFPEIRVESGPYDEISHEHEGMSSLSEHAKSSCNKSPERGFEDFSSLKVTSTSHCKHNPGKHSSPQKERKTPSRRVIEESTRSSSRQAKTVSMTDQRVVNPKPKGHSRTRSDTGTKSGANGSKTSKGGHRHRVRRQSPVEERLSVHESDSLSDAFDDDGLFQIDENFAKFLDDKTSCQK